MSDLNGPDVRSRSAISDAPALSGRLRPLRAPTLFLAGLLAGMISGLVGCSSDDTLSTAQRVDAAALIDERSAIAMIELSEDDLDCAVSQVSPDQLDGFGLAPPVWDPAAEAVVSCVGEELIGASVLRSQAGSVAATSLDCAVSELDRRVIVELVAGAMAQEPSPARAEIEVARALGVCLELGELLDQ